MMLKCRNHPSVIAIKNARNGSSFCVYGVSVNNVLKEIKRLKTGKATQITDIKRKC